MNAGRTGFLATLLGRDGGQNLVEYALMLIIFLLMMFGIIDFSRALYSYHFVSHAAREGARWAVVNGADCADDLPPSKPTCPGGPATQTDVQSYVSGIVPPGIDSSQVQVSATWPDTSGTCAPGSHNEPGCPVVVTVSYNFNFLVPLIHNGTLAMASTSEMVIAH
jgi:hypothetical protein